MKLLNKHRQVLVKVNARCDEGIAPLISALSEINGIITLDSCDEGILGESHVFFTFGENWRDLGNLLEIIYNELAISRLDELCSLKIEWCERGEWPRALMVMPKNHVATLSEGIRRLSSRINLRMLRLDDGTVSTVPRS